VSSGDIPRFDQRKLITRNDAGQSRSHTSNCQTRSLILRSSLVRLIHLPHYHPADISTWICLALQLTIWLIPNLTLNAIAFSFIGMFLGPIYPSAVMIISETLPLDLQLGVIAMMGSIGGGGGAAMPL
jgi:MFS family permease